MSAFSRALWRTSRNALRYNSSVNPLQQALGLQGSSRYANSVRTYAAAFQRDKPHVNVGMLGCHVRWLLTVLMANRHHWSRRSRKGRAPPPTPLSNLEANHGRPPSPQPSQNDRLRKATPSSSNTDPLTRPPRSGSVVSPSPRPISSTRPTTGTMPTSTAPVTPITSRT